MPSAITVIVPVFNEAAHIADCLKSLLAQSFEDWECMVVDDGSIDATCDVVAGFRDHRIHLIRADHGGVSAARNAGLALAASDYVMFLDGDDMLHPEALGRLHAALAHDSDAVAAFGTLRKIHDNGQPYPGQKPLALNRYPSGLVLPALLRSNFIANGGHMLLRRQTVVQVGGFDPRLKLSEDWHLWCRMAARGPFHFIGKAPEILYMRMPQSEHSSALSRDLRNHRSSLRAVLAHNDIRRAVAPNLWKPIRRAMMASQIWEAGRVNYTLGHITIARHLMMRSLKIHFRMQRLILMVAALAAHGLGLRPPSRFRSRAADLLSQR